MSGSPRATIDEGLLAAVEAIAERAGPAALARLWDGPESLPRPEEIEAPTAWMTRVLGGMGQA